MPRMAASGAARAEASRQNRVKSRKEGLYSRAEERAPRSFPEDLPGDLDLGCLFSGQVHLNRVAALSDVYYSGNRRPKSFVAQVRDFVHFLSLFAQSMHSHSGMLAKLAEFRRGLIHGLRLAEGEIHRVL